MDPNLVYISNNQLHSQQKNKILQEVLENPSDLNALQDLMTISNANYEFDADLYYLPPHSASDFAIENLYYIHNAGTLVCGEKFYTSRANIDSYLLLYVQEGMCELRYENNIYRMQGGDVCLIDCRKPHYYFTRQAPWVHTDIHIQGKHVKHFYDELMQDGKVVLSLKIPKEFETMISKLFYTYRYETYDGEWLVSNQIEQMLLYLNHERHKRGCINPLQENLLLLKTYMENNFTKKFTIDELAAFSGISKYYLLREFKKMTGFTPIDYLNEIRIVYAKNLLMNTSLSVQEISELSGYNSLNNFLKQFKKRIGTTPMNYRKSFLDNK